MARVVITRDYEDPETGVMFWAGETFEAMSGPPYEHYVEVKTAGEYRSVLAGHFRIDHPTT